MPAASSNPSGTSSVRRRTLLGTVILLALVALAGLTAYLTRDSRAPAPHAAPHTSRGTDTPSPAANSPLGSPPPARGGHGLPTPPATHDPVAFGKAAAAALWSYDTRAYSQPELVTALRGWLTSETKYADPDSLDAVVPSPALWKEMAANGQFATAKVNEGHFPNAFVQALQADPGAITQAYVYAVTVSGKQSIAWKGSRAGGAESRVTTLAVQCPPSQSCALVGVMPSVAP
ncbi:hypothetical protein AB0L33_15205 [Streptomyces sp. NPDC052299]|uniref:hypothetical protein n=1 Tax=Streptomyces sp. NPDC052299 TaxID=3155054 RepID=UPI00342A0169